MTLTELKYIVAVAREKHFGRAADACFVSQPTLSVAIKKLEEELDVKLFERNASEVAVTSLGEEIVRQAQGVLEQADGIRECDLFDGFPENGCCRTNCFLRATIDRKNGLVDLRTHAHLTQSSFNLLRIRRQQHFIKRITKSPVSTAKIQIKIESCHDKK